MSKSLSLKCVYAGRRLNHVTHSKVEIFHCFIQNGKEMFFKNVLGVFMGCSYECSQDTISRRPKLLADDRVDNPDWEAKDALAAAWLKSRRAKNKIKNLQKPYIKAAMQALIPLLKNLDSQEVSSLVSHLTFEAWDTTRKLKRK